MTSKFDRSYTKLLEELAKWIDGEKESSRFTPRVGDIVELRDGQKTVVVNIETSPAVYPVLCSNGRAYTIRGSYMSSGIKHPLDIVKIIKRK